MTQSWKSKRALSLALLFGGCATALGGCATTLDVRSDAGQGQYAEGVVQVLPFTQYEVKATWQLISCDKGLNNLALSMSAEADTQEDPAQRYLIDPTSLQQPLTRSDFGVSYFEGSNTIKAVNADVEDRTVQFVANVVTTLAKVASVAVGVAADAASTDSTSTDTACTKKARDALDDVARLKAALDSANEQVDAANQEVDRLTTVAQLVWEVDKGAAREITAALKRQDEATGRQAKLKKQLEKALESVTATVAVRWPEDGGQFYRDAPLLVPQAALDKWFENPPLPEIWLGSYLAIKPTTGRLPATQESDSSDQVRAAPSRVRGIPYRINTQGRLLSCRRDCRTAPEDEVETLVESNVAQLGGVKVLRVSNPPLGSTTFAAEFNRDATLVSTGFKQREAPLEVASSMVASTATTLAPLLDPVERAKRKTAHYNAIKELNEARKGARPATTDPVAEASATFQARTTLFDSERLMIEAQIARDQALTRIQQP